MLGYLDNHFYQDLGLFLLLNLHLPHNRLGHAGPSYIATYLGTLVSLAGSPPH